MRCILCGRLSLVHICKECQKRFLAPSLAKRMLFDDFVVYSFYGYSEIEGLIKTKHTYLGHYVYTILARNAFKVFSDQFSFPSKIFAIPIDDRVDSGYSHTAVLAKALESKIITPLYGVLRSQNRIQYAGKSYEERLKNPRNFKYSGKSGIDAILVDDIITTGLTLTEAVLTLRRSGVNVLFALALADARK